MQFCQRYDKKLVLVQLIAVYYKHKQTNNKQIIEEIDKLNTKLSKARELLLNEAIDASDYKEIKAEYEARVVRLEAQLAEQTSINAANATSIEKMFDKAITTLSKIDVLYTNASISDKRLIISSIYPEKISFDGFNYRTFRLNAAVEFIYQINNNLPQIKNRKSEDFFSPFR